MNHAYFKRSEDNICKSKIFKAKKTKWWKFMQTRIQHDHKEFYNDISIRQIECYIQITTIYGYY